MKELLRNAKGVIIGVRYRNLRLVKSPKSEVDALIVPNHYSRKPTRFSALNLLLFAEGYGDLPVGAIQLGYGIRPQSKHTISRDITKDNHLEFDRMWLSDVLPKNSETMVISMLLWFVKRWNPAIIYIITYADSLVGNVGTIYKASNAIFLEATRAEFFTLATGERVHPVTMWHRHGTRKMEVLSEIYPGITKISKERAHYRYLYILDKKIRKRWLSGRASRVS